MGKGKERYKKPLVNKPQLMPVKTKIQRAFTIKFNGRTNRIVTKVGICPAFDPNQYKGKEAPYKLLEIDAIWDTGATGSVLTTETVKQLGLTPIGSVTVAHAGGTSQSNTYLVNFMLPNRVGFPGVRVTECPNIVGKVGALIGMDIITAGDLALTNVNGVTWMSFRIPSMQSIDYVEEIKNLSKNQK